MKRDADYLREKLLEFESSEDYLIIDPLMMNMSEEQTKLHYHIQLLADAGYLVQTGNSVYRMTNDGHEFLEAIRDEATWEKTKAAINAASGATLGMLSTVALALGKQAIADKLGIPL